MAVIEKLIIGYAFGGFHRFIAFIFILASLCFIYYLSDKTEFIALGLLLFISGFYVFSVRTFLEKKGDYFRINIQYFYFLSSGKWRHESNYPLTSFKSIRKTFEMPNAFAMLNEGNTLVRENSYRIVLTDTQQIRFLNVMDCKTMDETENQINRINKFLNTEFAMWGSKMKKQSI
jgi:hypothetical protein